MSERRRKCCFTVEWVDAAGTVALERVGICLVAANKTEAANRSDAWRWIAEASARLTPLGYRARWTPASDGVSFF